MDREQALELLHRYTTSESLRKHALAAEAAMRWYARRLGEDEQTWGLVGLLHDFDYERWPEAPDHTQQGAKILRELGVDEVIVQAMLSHADYNGIPRDTPLRKAIFAVDELCGFVTAVAYVRPDRTLAQVTVKSVKKKMKDKGFARAVPRQAIAGGAELLGVPLDEHIANVIEALQGIHDALGL